jgi:hypothetical protein
MLSSSNPPSSPLWMDMSSDIGTFPLVVLPTEPLPNFENFFASKDTSSVLA